MKKKQEPRMPKGARYDFYSLCLASNEELESVMKLGVRPDAGELAGWELRGWNTSDLAYLIANKKFKKGFMGEVRDERLTGYNVVVIQNNLGEPWVERLRGTDSVKHGYYDAYPVRLDEVDNKYPNSILLNYGSSKRNFALNPARFLRDYLVRVYPDNPDLYLGKAYAALGPFRFFQSYFILERSNRSLV